MKELIQAHDEGKMDEYLAKQTLGNRKAITRLLKDSTSMDGFIDQGATMPEGLVRGINGEMYFKREDICGKDEKLIKLLTSSEANVIDQLIQTEAPDERQKFKDFLEDIKTKLNQQRQLNKYASSSVIIPTSAKTSVNNNKKNEFKM